MTVSKIFNNIQKCQEINAFVERDNGSIKKERKKRESVMKISRYLCNRDIDEFTQNYNDNYKNFQ